VSRTPQATAVVSADQQVSYQELNSAANGVAARLVAAGATRESLVGVCLPRDKRLVVGLLGVLKSGAAYVPMEPAYPVPRLRFVAADAGLRQVVTGRELSELTVKMGPEPIIVDAVEPQATNPDVAGQSLDPGYVLYTSGSTGQPKGVVVEHRMAVNFLQWAVQAYSPQELAGSLAALSVCFDVSILEIFAPLVSGGTVILAENLLELPALPARDRVTMISGPPSGLRALLHRPLPGGVRTINAAGEALGWDLLDELFAQPGVDRVVNGYGPTEATVLSHCQEFRRTFVRGAGSPPIGQPVAGAEPVILDPEGRAVPDGQTGELWLAGPGVARGYLHRPALTTERFVTDGRASGGRRYRTGDLAYRIGNTYYYAGRMDDQVKIRGHRVELGEVVQALTTHPEVHHAVALAPRDRYCTHLLVAYVEPTTGSWPSETDLREHLSRLLPGFLVPSRVIVLERLPLTPGGKADRAALLDLAGLAPVAVDGTPPRTPIEQRALAAINQTLRTQPPLGVNDNIFHHGGHSLTASSIVATLSEDLQIRLPLGRFLANPTAAGLAAAIEAGSDGTTTHPVRHAGRTEFPLAGSQWFMWMATRIWPGLTNTLAIRLRITGLTGAATLGTALDRIVARHQVLRTTVEVRNEQPVARVHPCATVPLTEIDLRSRPSGEAENRLAEIASEAARRSFDLTTDIPLARATIVWTGDQAAELILTVDHFAFDGYSTGLFAEELAASLDAATSDRPDPAPEPALQVGDLAISQQRQAADSPATVAMREFWRGELAGANSPNLPGKVRTTDPALGSRVMHQLDQDLTDRLAALQADCQITRFVLFASVLGIVLHARTGETDNLIGTLVALRDKPGAQRVIGPLVNLVPVRVRAAGDPSFRDLAHRITRTTHQCLANQDLGIAEIVRCSPNGLDPSRPLTPVVLSMQPATVPVTVEHGLIRIELVGEIDPGEAMCDVAILVNDTVAGPEILLTYDRERMPRSEAEVLLSQLLAVLAAAIANPDRPISQLMAPIPADR
jgi:amino acid adenylation domain-containing protein